VRRPDLTWRTGDAGGTPRLLLASFLMVTLTDTVSLEFVSLEFVSLEFASLETAPSEMAFLELPNEGLDPPL
jgi:hypothetical protein